MILLYILLRWQTYFNSRVISAVAVVFSLAFGIYGLIIFFKGTIQFLDDNSDMTKEKDEMSNFYVQTDRFFKSGGVLIDMDTGETFKMQKPPHSNKSRFPDDVADRKIRVFPFCSQEYEFSIHYRQSFNIQVYLEINKKKYDLCVKDLTNEFEKRIITGVVFFLFGLLLTLTIIILNIKSMTNSCVNSNTNLGSAISSFLGVIGLAIGAIFITTSLSYFLEHVKLTSEEKTRAGLPEPKLNGKMTAGLVLLIVLHLVNIFINTVGAILRHKELKEIRERAFEIDFGKNRRSRKSE
uniref:DUF5671 domain-containing protein n=1 Tax=Strongyloides papillosus TaxID=174720 RepID=A0A0N5BLR9_STREA